nr:MAG TPA: hypothetical protein [Caudoviricetes sp.]
MVLVTCDYHHRYRCGTMNVPNAERHPFHLVPKPQGLASMGRASNLGT